MVVMKGEKKMQEKDRKVKGSKLSLGKRNSKGEERIKIKRLVIITLTLLLIFSDLMLCEENEKSKDTWENCPWILIEVISVNDPLLDELKIELELTDEQLQKFDKVLGYERERDLYGRSLGYVERDLDYLKEREQNIEKTEMTEEKRKTEKAWIEDRRKKDKERIKEFKERLNRLPKLTLETIKQILTKRQYKQFNDWIEIQRTIKGLLDHSQYVGLVADKNRDKIVSEKIYGEFNKLWNMEKNKKKIYKILVADVEEYSEEIRKKLGLNSKQHEKVKKIIKSKKEQILELRKELTFYSCWKNLGRHQQILNQIDAEKKNMDNLIKNILTSEQRIRYQQIKEVK